MEQLQRALVSHAGRVLLKIVASRLGDYYENRGILNDEQCDFRPARLQELGRERKFPLYICFIDLRTAYDSVDRGLL